MRFVLYYYTDQHFDFLNWLYWNLWWQQYSYWTAVHQQSFTYQHWNGGLGNQAPDVGSQQAPVSGSDTNPVNRGAGGMGAVPGPQWNVNIGLNPFPMGRPQPQQPAVRGVPNRIVTGELHV